MSGVNFKFYENDVLTHDFTLCRSPEGRIGWWDSVDGVFHNETENLLKLGFKEPDGTQYIDTGFVPCFGGNEDGTDQL